MQMQRNTQYPFARFREICTESAQQIENDQ